MLNHIVSSHFLISSISCVTHLSSHKHCLPGAILAYAIDRLASVRHFLLTKPLGFYLKKLRIEIDLFFT